VILAVDDNAQEFFQPRAGYFVEFGLFADIRQCQGLAQPALDPILPLRQQDAQALRERAEIGPRHVLPALQRRRLQALDGARSLFSRSGGVIRGLGEMLVEGAASLQRPPAGEAPGQRAIRPRRHEHERIDSAGERFGRRAELLVNSTAFAFAQKKRTPCSSVASRQRRFSRTINGTPANPGSFSQPCLSMRSFSSSVT